MAHGTGKTTTPWPENIVFCASPRTNAEEASQPLLLSSHVPESGTDLRRLCASLGRDGRARSLPGRAGAPVERRTALALHLRGRDLSRRCRPPPVQTRSRLAEFRPADHAVGLMRDDRVSGLDRLEFGTEVLVVVAVAQKDERIVAVQCLDHPRGAEQPYFGGFFQRGDRAAGILLGTLFPLGLWPPRIAVGAGGVQRLAQARLKRSAPLRKPAPANSPASAADRR